MENVKNSVRLTGFAGLDPEIKLFGSDKRMARVNLGVSEFSKGNSDSDKSLTQWVTLVFWNKKVELVEDVISKGTRFSIEGKLNISSYDKGGEKRYKTEIVVNTLELIE